MSARQSNLSASGYDFVIATSQASINTILKQYLSKGNFAEIGVYFNADDSGDAPVPVLVDYNTLMTQTNNTDPLSVPAWNGKGDKPAGLDNILDSDFWYGFKAKIGLPPCTSASSIPDVVTINADQSATFNLMCSEFTVVEKSFGPHINYVNISQVKDSPWIFNSKVGFTAINNAINFPQDVQNQVAALQNAGNTDFSVQQLMFDLDNASLESVPTLLNGPDTTVVNALGKVFLGAYFNEVKKNGAPVLGYSILQQPTGAGASAVPAPIFSVTGISQQVAGIAQQIAGIVSASGNTAGVSKITHVALQADPYVGSNGLALPAPTVQEASLATLNYLGSVDGHNPSYSSQFGWNWLDENTNDTNYHGVIAVNRNTLAQYFKTQLDSIVSKNCFTPVVKVSLNWLSQPSYSFSMSMWATPSLDMPKTGQRVLSYTYTPDAAHDQAGAGGGIGQAKLQSSFSCTVDFIDNKIIITQHLTVYVWVKHLATSNGGNVIDQIRTDTYTLSIDDSTGKIKMSGAKSLVDNSQAPKANGFLDFFTGVNDLVSNVTTWLSGFVETNFTDVPLDMVQNFFFPGGNTFELKDVLFSDNQDLISHITYVDPSVNAANQRAIALKNANADSVGVATTMKNEGYSPTQIANGIKNAWNCFVGDVTYAMKLAGFAAADVCAGLIFAFGASAQDTTNAFRAMGFTPAESAQIIKDAYGGDSIAVADIMTKAGYTANDIAIGIKNAWNCFVNDVVYAMKAVGYNAEIVSGSVRNAFNASAQDVSNSLRVMGYPADDIARNLKDTFNADSISVASIMKNAGYIPDDIARGIKDAWNCAVADVTYAMKAVGYSVEEVSFSLIDTFNAAAQDVTNAFKAMGYLPDDVAKNLKETFSADSIAVADIMRKAGYSTDQISSGIKNAWNCAIGDVTYAMKAVGYDAKDVASSLKNTFNAAAQDVAAAFKAMGYTATDTESALVSVFAVSTSSLTTIMQTAYGATV